MKILYITFENLSLNKGSVVHVREIVTRLQNLGHQVGLVARAWNQFEKVEHFYNLHQFPLFLSMLPVQKSRHYFLWSLSLFFYLIKVLRQYDVIYARDYHTVLIAFLPRLLFDKKLVCEVNGLADEEQRLKGHSFHNRILTYLIQQAEKLATKCSDRIVSVTPQIASHLTTHYDCPREKVVVIGNGVNTNRFHPIENETLLGELRRRLGIERDEAIVAFVGNLVPWQGVEYLIRVAPLLVQEIKNIRFVIVGDGILKWKLEEDVKRLGLRDHFIFTGMIDYEQIPLYINIADVCVVLKRKLKSGYSPLKLYEYMACGKPVVATNTFGFELLLEEGVGLLVDPEHTDELIKATKFLIQERGKAHEMGQKGAILARERFGWDKTAKKVEEVLRGVLNRR